MMKKLTILGLLLLLAGSAVLYWFVSQRKQERKNAASFKLKYASEPDEYLKQYNEWLRLPQEERGDLSGVLDEHAERKTPAQLLQEQRERLKADLDKLAAGESIPRPLADMLYGQNWQEEVDRYKSRKEQNELTLTSAIVCASIGGMVSVSCTLVWTFRLMIRATSRVRAHRAGVRKVRQGAKDSDSVGVREDDQNDGEELLQSQAEQPKRTGTRSQMLANLGWHNLAPHFTSSDYAPAKKTVSMRRRGVASSSPTDKRIAMLLSDEESAEFETTASSSTESPGAATAGSDSHRGRRAQISVRPDENSQKLQGSFKAQAAHLEEQMAAFKEMAQNVQQTTLEQSKPLNNTLKELTQQISAIRDYASCQQDRVEKLQDGYDWTIIKTFCLRVIRCVDNLERRISQLIEEDTETTHLEEVRDELLFALESSGVEQFRPEIDSDYSGQEKFAEAAKDRQPCDDPSKTGTVAKVIRPGYQYFIDEENAKVVRTAQVELYG